MEHAEKRQSTGKVICVLAVLMVVNGFALLLLGFISSALHGPQNNGVPHYFIGPFIAAPCISLLGILGLLIFIRGKGCTTRVEALQKIVCLMNTYCVCAAIGVTCHVIAAIITLVTGLCPGDSECSFLTNVDANSRLATASLVFNSTSVLISFIGLFTVHKYATLFDLKLLGRGLHQVGVQVDQPTEIFQVTVPSPRQDIAVSIPQEPLTVDLLLPPEQEFRSRSSTLEENARWVHPTNHPQEHTRRVLDHIVYEKRHKKQRKRDKTRKKQGTGQSRSRKKNGRESSYYLPPLGGVACPPPPTPTPPPSPSPPKPLSPNPTPGPSPVPSIDNSMTSNNFSVPRVVFVKSSKSSQSSSGSASPDTPPSSRQFVDSLKPTSRSPPPSLRCPSPEPEYPNPYAMPHISPPSTPPHRPTLLFVKPLPHPSSPPPPPSSPPTPNIQSPDSFDSDQLFRPSTPPSYMSLFTIDKGETNSLYVQ